MPESPLGRSTRWLTALTIDPATAPAGREDVRRALDAIRIESRPLWKPMHQQPVFADHRAYLTGVADRLFERGLCLPSGSSLTTHDLARVAAATRAVWTRSDVHS